MYETAGRLTTVLADGALVWLVVLPLFFAVVAALRAAREGEDALRAAREGEDALRAAREGEDADKAGRAVGWLAVVASATTLGVALFEAVRAARAPELSVAEQQVGTVVRLGQLDLQLTLSRSPSSASLALVIAALGLCAVLFARARPGAARSLAWTGTAVAAAMLVVLADDWSLLCVGLGLGTLTTWGAPRARVVDVDIEGARRARSLAWALLGDVGVLLAGWALFWSLGGTFGSAGYQPDTSPRFALVQLTDAVAPTDKVILSSDVYAGAEVTADEGPPLVGEPLRAPFSATVDPGVRTLRVHVGAGALDHVLSHVTMAPGRAYALTSFGPTSSGRGLTDQLAGSRPTTAGPTPSSAILASRPILGVPLGLFVVLLVVLASLLRLAAFVRSGAPSGPSLAIDLVVPVALALRVAPLLDATPAAASLAAVFPALAALAFACEVASAPVARVPRALAAALASFAITAVLLGQRGPAVVVVVAAAASVAAITVLVLIDGDVRWLGVACAAAAGVLPGAGTSAGLAAVLAGAFSVAAAGRAAGALVAPALVVTVMLLSLGVFRVYDAHSSGRLRGEARVDAASRGSGLAALLAAGALLSGVVLGVGSSTFGGDAPPLASRMVVGGDPFPHGHVSLLGFGLAASASVVGLAAARVATGAPGTPAWIAILGGASWTCARVGDGIARAASFLGRSVRVLDELVIERAMDLATWAVLGVARAARLVESEGPSSSGRMTLRRDGVDDPKTWSLVRGGLVLGMVALLGAVVLSSMLRG